MTTHLPAGGTICREIVNPVLNRSSAIMRGIGGLMNMALNFHYKPIKSRDGDHPTPA